MTSLGVRPTVENVGRVLLEVHRLHWPADQDAYGRLVSADLPHKLHDKRKYPSLESLQAGIARDTADAKAWFAAV